MVLAIVWSIQMQSRRKLKFRLIVSFTLFGFGLSALFAVAALGIRLKVEDQLVNNSLKKEVDSLNKQVRTDPTRQPRVNMIQAWTFSRRKLYKAPQTWQHLTNGVHDIQEIDASGHIRRYKLAVKRQANIISFVLYDVSRNELGKRQLLIGLIGAVILFGLLSLAIGWWLSRKVLKPVTDLAVRLRHFRRLGKAEPLAPHFADDEVGELALALDQYAVRLTAVVERDREFNSDVSHELRTPLTVIASTTELLQDSSDLSPKLSERLKRIARASRQASELVEALLLLSREEQYPAASLAVTEVGKVASEVIESQRPQVRDKPVQIELVVNATVHVNAPAAVLAVALTNIIGNAIKYTLEGTVRVQVDHGRIEVMDTGTGIGAEDSEHLFQRGVRGKNAVGMGAGLGLAIVLRLCDLYGWKVSICSRSDATGSIASIRFH